MTLHPYMCWGGEPEDGAVLAFAKTRRKPGNWRMATRISGTWVRSSMSARVACGRTLTI